jgi:hypothetical protein
MELVSSCRFAQLVILNTKLPISRKKSSKLIEFLEAAEETKRFARPFVLIYRASVLLLF